MGLEIEYKYLFEILDIIGFASTWYAKWLSANRIKKCYIIYSLHAIYWLFRGYMLGLYTAPLFCLCNVVINIYGFIKWGKKDRLNE